VQERIWLDAFAHLRAVTGMSVEQAQEHVRKAFQVWQRRSARDWTLDLSLVTTAAITLAQPRPPTAEQALPPRSCAALKGTCDRRASVFFFVIAHLACGCRRHQVAMGPPRPPGPCPSSTRACRAGRETRLLPRMPVLPLTRSRPWMTSGSEGAGARGKAAAASTRPYPMRRNSSSTRMCSSTARRRVYTPAVNVSDHAVIEPQLDPAHPAAHRRRGVLIGMLHHRAALRRHW
jgi:hypothetical protein